MDINLLPWREEIVDYNKKVFTRLMLAALILAGFFLIFAYHLFFQKISSADSYTQELEKAKVNLVSSVTAYFNFQKIQKEVNGRYLMLQKLQYSRFETVFLLNGLAKVTPKGVYINTLTREGDRLDLTGAANSNLLITKMMELIESSKNIKVISLQKVEKAQGQNVTVTSFDLQLALTLPSALSDETGKKADKLQLQNPVNVIQQHRDEQDQKINDAIKP